MPAPIGAFALEWFGLSGGGLSALSVLGVSEIWGIRSLLQGSLFFVNRHLKAH